MWKIKNSIKRDKPNIGEVELVYLDKDGEELPQRLVFPCHVLNDPAETKTLNNWQVLEMLATITDFMHEYLWENSTALIEDERTWTDEEHIAARDSIEIPGKPISKREALTDVENNQPKTT